MSLDLGGLNGPSSLAPTRRLRQHAPMLTLADIEAAAARIAGRVRRTPLLDPQPCERPAGRRRPEARVLQVTGSFKARGASTSPEL